MIPPEAFTLTMENQFHLHTVYQAIDNSEAEELKRLTKELAEQLAVKDNIIKHLMSKLAKNGLI
jgi:Mn-dependent DtxR family transcriptional regulator